jgi:hypothetical protein
MKEQSYTSTPPMGRTACTEPQCLYKGDLYLDLLLQHTETEGRSSVAEGSMQLEKQCYTARRTGEKPTTHAIYSLAKRLLASQLGLQSTLGLAAPVLTDVQTY